jgi:hypothetical protein
MSPRAKKTGHRNKGEFVSSVAVAPIELSAIGLESEFSLFVDDRLVTPEHIFGTPQRFVRQRLVHRVGTSYHLPTGGAIYFDTGVIEVATPVIEIDRGCAARAGRSLWESILFVRDELDAWERGSGRTARLAGFSTHYNISSSPAAGFPSAAFPSAPDRTNGRRRRDVSGRRLEDLAFLLAHILPIPVLLLAANRRSTGIGVRPRGDRIEVTADFTPSPSLMIAAATLITGVVRAVMEWPRYDVDVLRHRRIPFIADFQPLPHTSRKGWLARAESYSESPFAADIDDKRWVVDPSFFGEEEVRRLSMREIARYTFFRFRRAIRRISDPFSYRLLASVFYGRVPVLLDLEDRPPAYEDVGRLCTWDNLFPERMLGRSRYERVLIRAISGERLVLDGTVFRPVGMRGWSEVVFERLPEGTRHRFPIDFLLRHLESWEKSA